MASSQINIRVSESLRIEGNAALDNAGWTPSRAVRALWAYAAAHKDQLDDLRDTLTELEGAHSPTGNSQESRGPSPCKTGESDPLSEAVRGATIISDGLAALGLELIPAATSSPSALGMKADARDTDSEYRSKAAYENLREEILRERLASRGLL